MVLYNNSEDQHVKLVEYYGTPLPDMAENALVLYHDPEFKKPVKFNEFEDQWMRSVVVYTNQASLTVRVPILQFMYVPETETELPVKIPAGTILDVSGGAESTLDSSIMLVTPAEILDYQPTEDDE